MKKRPSLRMLSACASIAAIASAVRAAQADPPPPVDVVLREPTPIHRTFSLEYNPLSLFIDRFSLNLVVVPKNHHALVVSPFYTWANTVPYATGIDANGNALTDANGNPYTLNVLAQTFHGWGTELGYRYYFDKGGPRGLFVGPSIILAWMTATGGNSSSTSYLDFGIAADVGYQMLVADRISVSLGGGLQLTAASKPIPDQQLPASIYANTAFHPRLLLSLGYAF